MESGTELLGGTEPEDATVLAISAACRHPGIGLAIAAANSPDRKLAPAAVLLYLLVSTDSAIPYLAWRKRRHQGLMRHATRSA